MTTTSDEVERHYARAGIAERVLAALHEAGGADAAVTPETLAPLDHFHGRGVLATKELAALLQPQADEDILDIGSGIGGPARWIAAQFGCRVTGIDLTAEFCHAAKALNEACGLTGRVRIHHGSALALPFPDNAFDRAYSQNVVMNIADKRALFRGAWRVLKPGGVLALANLCAGRVKSPRYPVPWADTPETSFLVTPEEMRADLEAAGFTIVSLRDTTAEVLPASVKNRQRVEMQGLPRLGVHVIMGERMRELQINSARNLEEGRVAAVEALVRKPG